MLTEAEDIQLTARSATVTQSNPFYREDSDIERMRAEDRVVSRLRLCWLLPLILLLADFPVRQIIFRSSTVGVLEAWLIACGLTGLTAFVVVLVPGRWREIRSVRGASGHRIAGILVSIALVAWVVGGYYSIKKLQGRAREIYQRQSHANDLKDG